MVMVAAMAAYCYRSKALRGASLFARLYWPAHRKAANIFKLGFPISLSLLFEVSLYSLVVVLLLPYGENAIASHQIAMSFVTLIYMFPLSVSMVVTIKVAYHVGAGDFAKARRIHIDATILGLALSVVTLSLTAFFAGEIASVYTRDRRVVELAASLLIVTAIYQPADMLQAVAAGALKGHKDTMYISVASFVSFWICGLSTGYVLAMTDLLAPRMGAGGVWIGFVVGSACAAVLFIARLVLLERRSTVG